MANALYVTLFAVVSLFALLALRLPVHLTLAVVPILTALAYGGPLFFLKVLEDTLTSGVAWGLVLNVFAVAWLVSLYGSTLVVDRMGKELTKALRSKFLGLTLVPGALGLLPVAGGALMSAPIVDSLGEGGGFTKLRKNIVNVWYRHVFVYAYPLNPAILMTASIFGLSVGRVSLDQLIVAVFMFLVGVPLVGLRLGSEKDRARVAVLAKDVAPIVVSVALAFLLRPVDRVVPLSNFSVTLGVLLGIALFVSLQRAAVGTILRSLIDRRAWELTVVSLEAMVLRTVFMEMDVGPIVEAVASASVPPVLIAIALCGIFSFVGGLPSTGIAIAAPIVQALAGSGRFVANMSYASAFLFYLGSPLHLCYLYSSRYFGVSLLEGYRYLLPLTLTTMLFTFFIGHFVWS